MRALFKTICIAALAVVLLLASALPCLAAQRGIISVTLEDKNKKPVNDMQVHLCQIAQLSQSGYYPTAGFENSGISISGIVNAPNAATAKAVAEYVKGKDIPTLSQPTEGGVAYFSDLALGIWLVYCGEDEKYTFNPYIVLLPYATANSFVYEIHSTPKLENSAPNKTNIYVIKKWNDKNNAPKKRPNSVTIELLNGSNVVATKELNEENGWAHTFLELPKDGNYTVREQAVAHYKADYSGDAVNGFVVTNTYDGEKLPQTGQYRWPILFIAIAGVCFVLLGVYEIGVKKNGKKN